MRPRALFCATSLSFLCWIAGGTFVRAQSCISTPNGLVAWYTGDRNANDATGAYNPFNTNALRIVPAKVANGLTFGSGGFIDVAHRSELALQRFTLQAWVRPDGPGPNNDQFGSQIVAKNINRLSGVQSSFSVTWNATSNRFNAFVQTGSIVSSQTYPPGQFYHVAVTYDGAALGLYVNGVLDNQTALTDTIEYDPTVPLTIGATFQRFRDLGFPRTWNGIIDELQIINRALSDTEIADIYAADQAGYCKAPVIISPLSVRTTEGQLFTYQIVADNRPTSFSAGPLPPGLVFDAALGVITGNPTQAGTYEINLSAENGLGTDRALLSLVIDPVPSAEPVIISGTSVTGRVGERFRFQAITIGGTPDTRLDTSGLPPGLTVDSVSGIISGTPTADGSYRVTLFVTDNSSTTTTATLQITITADPAVPAIISSDTALLTPGQFFSYTITAPSSEPPDATSFSLAGNLPSGLTFDPKTGIISGTYQGAPMRNDKPPKVEPLSGGVITNVQLFARNPSGTGTRPLVFFLAPVGTVNISTRIAVGTGEDVLIGGFIITGNAPKKVILRAIGPSLNASGVAGALQDPRLELFDGAGEPLGSNDNWRSNQEQEIIETAVAPTDDREGAALATLAPGNYTAIVSGNNETSGIGLVEVYDLGTASLDNSSNAQLAQISTRGRVLTGENVMIGGFIVSGANVKVLVRGIGPSLRNEGVADVLADPTLSLIDGNGEELAANDNWKESQQGEIEATTVPPRNDAESAIVRTLTPGPYTAILRGKDDAVGVALVEVYNLR